MGTELTKVTFPDTNYIDLNSRVSNVAWDNTNKKLTQTFGKITTDIVTGETILDPLIPVKTANGSLVSFADGADLPMPSFICNIDAVQDLHGYDAPWVGGAGKNKLSIADKTATTVDNLTITPNKDADGNINGIKLDGSLTRKYYGYEFFVGTFPAGSYILNADFGILTQDKAQVLLYNDDYTTTYAFVRPLAPSVSFTLSSDTKIRAQLYTYKDYDYSNIIIKPMIRLATETDPTYAPYSNICPISGHTGVDAWVRGKNHAQAPQTGVYHATDGSFSTNNTYAYSIAKVRPNTTYTVSVGAVGNSRAVLYYTGDPTTSPSSKFILSQSPSQQTTYTFTTPQNCEYVVYETGGSNTPITPSTIGFVQIEVGSTATTYKPYNPNSQTIQVSWQTEAGEVFGGYVDLVSGVLTVTWVGNVYDGSNDEYWTIVPNDVTAKIIGSAPGSKSILSKCISNCFYSNYLSPWTHDNTIWIRYGQLHVNPDSSIVPSGITQEGLTEWRTWLSTNNLQAVYELATPITYQLTPTQIKSLLGSNNAWCDTGDVNVKYITQPYDGISAKYSEYAYNALNKTGDTMTGDLTLYMEGTTTNNYPTSLIFKNKNTTTEKTSTGYFQAYEGGANGINFMISPGGNMFIGSGEGARNHYKLYEHSTTEHFYATSDANMFLQAGGGTIANRKGLLLNASHELLPCAADVATNNIGSIGNSTHKWASVYATSLHGSLIGDISGGTGLTSNQVTTALGFTPGTSNLTLGTSSTTALKGDTKYAGSSTAGGAATSAAKLTNTSKIGDTNKPVYFTASGVPAAISYTINKSVPSDAVFTDHYAWSDITSKPTTLSGYGITDALPLSGGTLTGWLAFAGSDINLKTAGASSNDSSDIAWWYGNGKEKARIWTDTTYTTKRGLNYRVYKEDGTALYSGRLATLDDVQTYTFSTGTNVGQIRVTPSSGNAYDVNVKGYGANQKLEALYTSGGSAALPGSTFSGNGKRGYLFIVFNTKTPSSSNRAVACIPMVINTVYYVPFVVGTSFKSARFELQAPTGGGDGIVINFLSISDSNFGVEAIWG